MTSNYWTSTQCNHWVLNHTQLAIARAEDLQYADSPEEYTAIRIWLINCICLLTKRLSLRQRITATSIVFFHRFYSCAPGNSFSSTDPALVATACVYVASKVEETPMHIRVVVQEASKLWAELGHWKFPNDVSSLAEMEFYLLEDLHFHMIVYHPYRSLVAIHTASGKGATKLDMSMNASSTWASLFGSGGSAGQTLGGASATASAAAAGPAPVGGGELGSGTSASFMDPDLAYGSPGSGLSGRKPDGARAIENGDIEKIKQLDKQSQLRVMQEMIDERHRMFLYGGDDSMPLPRLEELDEQVLQMAWFVLNDTYRTDVLLLFPPHLIAVAAIFLAIVLHDPSRERMMRSKRWMDDRRERYRANLLHPKGLNAKSGQGKQPMANGSSNGTPFAATTTTTMTTSTTSAKSESLMAATTTPPVLGASPPKPYGNAMPSPMMNVTSPSPSHTSSTQASATRAPLRGLASLPPRPAHLPMKPMGHPPPPSGSTQAHSTSSHQSPPQQSPQIGASPSQMTSPATMAGEGNDLMPAIAATAEQNACNPPVPPPDAMTFLASLNVDLNAVGEIVQEMLSLYDLWHRVSSVRSNAASTAAPTPTHAAASAGSSPGANVADAGSTNSGTTPKESGPSLADATANINIGDGPDMFRRLTQMRERRREDLLRNGAGL